MPHSSETKRIDLHIHTNYSIDSKADPFDVVNTAIKKGFSGIAITDHNSVKAHLELGSYAEDRGLALVRGVELSARPWHLLFLGVPTQKMDRWMEKHDIPQGDYTIKDRKFKLRDALQFVIDEGGVTIVPHPGLGYMSMLLPKLHEVAKDKLVHGVEIHNGDLSQKLGVLYTPWHNIVTSSVQYLELSKVANSDAHKPKDIGRYYNLMESKTSLNEVKIIEGIRFGTIYAAT